ncbi:hypothetical protein CF326_g4332 [Tilletia indica]|nr:hypothetical protein CF326_g4332 [Tilletia indica]
MARKRTTAAQKKAAVKEELVDVKPIQAAAPTAGPSTPSSSFASSSNVRVKAEKKSASPLVKKDPDEDGSSMDEGDDEASTPVHQGSAAPLLTPGSLFNDYGGGAHLGDEHYAGGDESPGVGAYILYGASPLFSVPSTLACSICSSRDGIQYATDPNDPMALLQLYCKMHNPEWTMHKSDAIKHFAKYKNVGGNLNDSDLLKAESEGKVEVRYRRNPHTRSGLPKMRLYWVRELYALSRAKEEKKKEEAQAKRAEKEEEARIKLAQRQERKAQAEKEKAEKMAQKKAAAALARQKRSTQAENSAEPGPSSSVTVTSTSVFDVSGNDDDEATAPQAPPPSIPAAAPQSDILGYRVKPEPGLEFPMLPPNAGLSASDSQSYQVKQEANDALFRSDDS